MNSATVSCAFQSTLGRRPVCRPRICTSRLLSTTCSRHSGHNRWSKIKHDKAKVDAGLSKQRSYLAREIIGAVKANGPDPSTNPRLSTLLAEAKRSDFPKASIERAVARGQGISPSGTPLESMTVEFMLPPSVAGILEVETDRRSRTIPQLKEIFKSQGASLTSSAYLFDRLGRVFFEQAPGLTEETVLESAIEAGALDVEEEAGDEEDGGAGGFVVWTEMTNMAAVAAALEKALGTTARSQELVYKAKEDSRVKVESEELDALMTKLSSLSEVQNVYLNVI